MNLNVVLSPDGIDKAIKELDQYKDLLRAKLNLFVSRLANNGYHVINERKQTEGDSDSSFAPTVRIKTGRNTCRATVSISGRDVLFVEFGAGVHYNGSLGSSPNPKGLELGYYIGSYPQQKHAGEDFWFYQDESGKWQMSHGTKAGMPMYRAALSMRAHIASIAQEVFGSNG